MATYEHERICIDCEDISLTGDVMVIYFIFTQLNVAIHITDYFIYKLLYNSTRTMPRGAKNYDYPILIT